MELKELSEKIKVLTEKGLRKGFSDQDLLEMNLYGWDRISQKCYRIDDIGLGYPGFFDHGVYGDRFK